MIARGVRGAGGGRSGRQGRTRISMLRRSRAVLCIRDRIVFWYPKTKGPDLKPSTASRYNEKNYFYPSARNNIKDDAFRKHFAMLNRMQTAIDLMHSLQTARPRALPLARIYIEHRHKMYRYPTTGMLRHYLY
ncbi:hypothetical protein EVAR_69690_1 [Eumeta japonica]|uniref:Uncharacterized protein n=1 Tax=Eumeta variegata TaxID=151549 RepID=A0A4C2A4N6_EUMVA|nr:hypothetical protein EVAR_69690_1 [Eumeta japonica]